MLALFMASVGIHGTVGFAVMQRTQEIGIRMALGARRGSVLGLVLSETMRPVIVGLAAGFAIAAIVSRLMVSFLFGLSALDPVAFRCIGLPGGGGVDGGVSAGEARYEGGPDDCAAIRVERRSGPAYLRRSALVARHSGVAAKARVAFTPEPRP